MVVHQLIDAFGDVLLLGDHFGNAVLVRSNRDKAALREDDLTTVDLLEVLGVAERDSAFGLVVLELEWDEDLVLVFVDSV